MTDETQHEKKLEFAADWLRSNDPWKSASKLFPADPAAVMRCVQHWVNDEVVLGEKKRILEEFGEAATLPTKAETARAIWDRAHNERTNNTDYVRLMQLYADIMAMIAKPAAVQVNNVQEAPKVMIVRDHGTDSDWEAKLQAQQDKLVSDANAAYKH